MATRGFHVLAGAITVSALSIALVAPLGAQDSPAAPTPRTADGHPDLTGIWGSGNAGAQNSVQEGDSLVVLYPLAGADPFEGKDLFRGLDRAALVRKAAAPNKPPYKPELAAKVQALSDQQTK